MLVTPWLKKKGYEAIGSMGDDTRHLQCFTKSRHISNYFKQHFAQVSNPPIDPIRERFGNVIVHPHRCELNVLEETPSTHQSNSHSPTSFF